MTRKKVNQFLFLLISSWIGVGLSSSIAQDHVYAGERIVVLADGNEHSKSDWGATPLSLALLASKGLQDQVVVYAFSAHTWGSNKSYSKAESEMKESAFLGAKNFGFKKTKFIEVVTAPNYAIIEITLQVNKSSAKNPLIILVGGPMDVLGTALNEADTTKLKHVTLISHSIWDQQHADSPEEGETHKGWTWNKIKDSFSNTGLQLLSLAEGEEKENSGLKAEESRYAWIKNSPSREAKFYEKGSWDWLYARLEASKEGTVIHPFDANLVLYLLTGKRQGSPEDLRELLENPEKF